MTGATHTSTLVVQQQNSALAMGSGDLAVLATPAMIALMENAAMHAIAPYLAEGESSVGTYISVEHTKATGIGTTVLARATVRETDGRNVEVDVVAEDESGVQIGRGRHTRFVINTEKFMSRISAPVM